VRIPSSASVPIQCKDTLRHKVTSSYGFKDFQGTAEETSFWNGTSEEEKQALRKKHVQTGVCLLCMIDELIAQKKPEPEPVIPIAVEKPAPQQVVREPAISRKVTGGIINRTQERTELSTPNLKVSWTWHNEERGMVEWTFQNIASQQASCILLRNSYYFGNAFWPIYVNNHGFGIDFAKKLEPLVDKSIQSNTPPLGVVSWKQADESYKNIVCFVFTLAPGQTWRMREGGFSPVNPPRDIGLYEVTPVNLDPIDFALTYDEKHVDTWVQQTGASDQAYDPNPKTFNTVQLLAPAEAPFEQLFEDSRQGKAEEFPPKAEEEEESPSLEEPLAPTPSPSYEGKLWSVLAKNAQKNS
jgi:hypothetical protein